MNKLNHYQEKITVVVILYKEKFETIISCLRNIKNFKTIIIDNANDKDLKKRLNTNHSFYKYILNEKNIGFASAAYQGINECETEYIFFLTADCLISEENIFLLLEAKNKYKDCYLTSPTFYDEKDNLTYNGGLLPENGDKSSPLKLEGDACVESVITTAVLFNVEEIKKIGSIDKNFFIYFMDDELCRRIRQNKKSVIQVYNSKAKHVHGNLKIDNKLKKIFFRNYHFTFDELYYYYKNDINNSKLKEIKKKFYKYIVKIFLNLLILRFEKSVYYFSKTLAYFKFVKKTGKF